MTPTISEALDKLAALGSPDQIALHLADLGVQGVIGDSNACVIAVHLRDCADQVSVTHDSVRTYRRDGDVVADHLIPPAVRAFIEAFDFDHYPELIA